MSHERRNTLIELSRTLRERAAFAVGQLAGGEWATGAELASFLAPLGAAVQAGLASGPRDGLHMREVHIVREVHREFGGLGWGLAVNAPAWGATPPRAADVAGMIERLV